MVKIITKDGQTGMIPANQLNDAVKIHGVRRAE